MYIDSKDRSTFETSTNSLSHRWFQPYSAWIGLIGECLIVFFYGYSSFTPWTIDSFLTHYAMLMVAPVLFLAWKIMKGTKIVKPLEADLVWERPVIDAYEAADFTQPVGFWTEVLQMFGLKGGAKGMRQSLSICN